MIKLRTNVNLEDEKTRAIYFHDMAEDSRELELLLNTCYNYKIIPLRASKGKGKDSLAYIILKIDKNNIENISMLMDLVKEIPNCEFNVKSNNDSLCAELSCDSKDSEQLFTRIKDVIEESLIEKKHVYNFTVMKTIYNIAKIVGAVTEADILFAVDENLYTQGKCALSIYKENHPHKLNTKKPDNIIEVIETLKNKATLNIPTVFFCTFQELRTFYFELDETVYSNHIEGED
ncbi:MAG: hypothetical protein IKG27_00840 [Bacilli bacterium]|nr:hypothetical protein [Bacilli bacterium]